MASTNSSVGITINIVCKEVQYDFSDFSTDDEVGTVYMFIGHFEKNNKRYAIVSVVDSPDKDIISKKSKKDSNSMASALIEAIAKNM